MFHSAPQRALPFAVQIGDQVVMFDIWQRVRDCAPRGKSLVDLSDVTVIEESVETLIAAERATPQSRAGKMAAKDSSTRRPRFRG
jgi:hypothetical protein